MKLSDGRVKRLQVKTATKKYGRNRPYQFYTKRKCNADMYCFVCLANETVVYVNCDDVLLGATYIDEDRFTPEHEAETMSLIYA